jgi:ADP-ribose pyrophosphatase YjhB (NUDIX family)
MAKSGTPAPTFARPLTTVDVVIFAVANWTLNVLLVHRPAGEPFSGAWALPGGFVDIEKDKDLEACALRKLKDKTGVSTPYLEQLGSWGSAKRDPRGWSATHAYFALIPAESPEALPQATGADARWVPVVKAEELRLAFDHSNILATGLERLRNKVEYTSLPAFLLPAEFTLSDLQHTYEAVLGRKLEKSAFRTRVLAARLVEPTKGVREGPNRPATLYKLRNPHAPVYFARTFKPRGR